jgi:hypothetical protein
MRRTTPARSRWCGRQARSLVNLGRRFLARIARQCARRIHRSRVHNNFPDECATRSGTTQSLSAERCVDRKWRVKVDAEMASPDAHQCVGQSDAGTYPPRSSGIDRAYDASRSLSRTRDERLHVRITADHAIERHDIGRVNAGRKLHEIAQHEPHAIRVTTPRGFALRRLEKVGRDVDVGGAIRPAVEQRMMNGPDTAPMSSSETPATPTLRIASISRRVVRAAPRRR